MTDQAPAANTPLAIDRVDSARGDGDSIRLRLTGRWLGAGHPGEHDALLVVQLQGRRHRFPAMLDPPGATLPPGAWAASFTLPAWAEPRQHGQAALWLGNAVIPVAPPRASRQTAPPEVVAVAAPEPRASSPPPEPRASSPPPVPSAPLSPVAPAAAPSGHAHDPSRAGPLADLLFKETVSALHSELEQRSADAARLRGALADSQSELDARAATQAGLEAAHGELRAELQQLIAAVARQRAEFDEWRSEAEAQRTHLQQQLSEATAERDARAGEAAALAEQLATASSVDQRWAEDASVLRGQLAAASVSRDAAISEVAGLRAELERLGTELGITREQLCAQGGDLGESQRLLADARALTEQLRGPLA
jgi:hypothetical protein